MQLVERHIIAKHDPRFAVIDAAAFAAKNLYNATNYLMRQEYISHGERVISYEDLYHAAKTLPAYQGIPAKVAQQVIKLVQKTGKRSLPPAPPGSMILRSFKDAQACRAT